MTQQPHETIRYTTIKPQHGAAIVFYHDPETGERAVRGLSTLTGARKLASRLRALSRLGVSITQDVIDQEADRINRTVRGYDGRAYTIGSRVEIHPGTDLWMQGARYGTVVRISSTPKDRVHVRLDKISGRTYAGSEDTFRAI